LNFALGSTPLLGNGLPQDLEDPTISVQVFPVQIREGRTDAFRFLNRQGESENITSLDYLYRGLHGPSIPFLC